MTGKIPFAVGLALALGAGWAGFPYVLYQRTPQPVQFSHKVHTGDKGGMKCDDCHAFRDDGSFAGIPALEKCATCHAQALGDTAAEKAFVKDYVTPNREVRWAVYAREPDNAWFSHASHVKLAKLACERCHGDHGKTDILRVHQSDRVTGYSRDVWTRMRMDDCIACHRENKLAHSCLDCHK